MILLQKCKQSWTVKLVDKFKENLVKFVLLLLLAAVVVVVTVAVAAQAAAVAT